MLRAAVLWAVLAALTLGGCGDDGSSEGDGSRPAATATAASSDFYAEMDDLVTRLDQAVAAAIAGEEAAVKRIDGVVRDVRSKLREQGAESPAGNLVLTTAAQARDYARTGERAGLELIREVPIAEARDLLKSEAGG